MVFKSQLASTRFVYVQEGLIIGLVGSIAKALWPPFPIIELFGFVGPIIGLAFGLKTYGDIQTEKTIAKSKKKKDEDEYIDG
jgi:xanthosine utilization system XapX-like protein